MRKAKVMELMMTPTEYLKKPYGRVVVPESDGSFRAEIIEFPGCLSVGDTAAEALSNLERVAESWLEAVISKGQRVPEPVETSGFSGKLMVRLPKSLHKRAAHMGAHEGVSLNQFIVSSIAEQVGIHSTGGPSHVLMSASTTLLQQTVVLQALPTLRLGIRSAQQVSTKDAPELFYAGS